MKSERWERVEELFHSARVLPEPERVLFLAKACKEDSGLLFEVRSLLEVGVTGENWLDLPAIETLTKAVAGLRKAVDAGRDSKSSRDPFIGKTINQYRILEQLGVGGMGVVYRAHDDRLRRDVALKLLTVQGASRADQRARILSEARAASALNHPGITTIYEVSEEGDHLFIVMELVRGKLLREAMRAGPIEIHLQVRLAAQISDALAAAHSQSVIHGDIKPENIMVLPGDRVKLLDFGVARQELAETGTIGELPTRAPIAGTLAYMAPEKFSGSSGDARSDLFSFGVLLYEMAAGKRPFSGANAMALAAQIMKEDPVPLRGEGGHESEVLSRITYKLLQKDPASRYQSAQELQQELNTLSRHLEIEALLPAAVAGKTTIAVLPFKLLTPTPEDEYLRVALADPVINRLSASGDLLVRPRSAVMRYANQNQVIDLNQVARELGVEIVVDGSIQKIGQRLRVHVQAWSVRDGSSRISTRFDSEASEIFQLQDRITGELARVLNPTAPLPQPGGPPTKNLAAYELFLRALERMGRLNRWDLRIAIEMFENATALDPHFADAWAGLAEACAMMGGTFEPGQKWLNRAEKAVRKALSLDRDNVEAYVARGRVVWTPVKKFQTRTSLLALEQALQRRPTHDRALGWQGFVLMHIGLQAKAKECLATSLAVCPDNTFTLTVLGTNALYAGQFDEAWDWHARALSIDRTSLWANLLSPAAPLYAGQLEKAAQAIRAGSQVFPKDPLLASYEALLCAKLGDRRKAEQLIQKAIHGGASLLHTHHMMHNVAAAYGVLGKPQQAVNWLRKASCNGLPLYPVFRDEPHFEGMRSYPPYLGLLATLKKQWTSFNKEFGALTDADSDLLS